ncbi:MAG: FHA domain-containing protein [Planctomycetes bacterium]|nr:FHA domain-containing protein [Planctomycetota bacterium]
MSARLYVLSGPDLGRSFALDEGATLGRSTDCSVPLRDASISRVHARVVRRTEGLVLQDQQSRNGLWHKGARVPELALVDLVEFKVGEVLVRVRLEAGTEARGPGEHVEFDVAPKPAEPKPAAAPPPAPPKPAATLELEEIVLKDFEPEPIEARLAAPAPAPASAAPRARPAEPARPARPASPRPGAAPLAATKVSPALEARGQRVLQYSKVEGSGGLLTGDLEQRPAWFKLLVIVLAMALCAAVTWFVFSGTTFLRERAQGAGASEGASEAPAEPAK